MLKELEKEIKTKMDKAIEATKHDFSRVRTGRASLTLLEGIKVTYYGSVVPLNQVAALNVPDSRLITIQPWDAKLIEEIEKALLKSDLGLTPADDGKIIRLPIPALTEERRKELVKVIRKMGEKTKVSLRTIRREVNDKLKTMKNDKQISEDDHFSCQEEVQKITDEYIKKADDILAEKEKELMEL
jgi:ribosome recycling factor